MVMVIAAAAVVDFDGGGVHRGRNPKFVGHIEAGGSPQRLTVALLVDYGCHVWMEVVDYVGNDK